MKSLRIAVATVSFSSTLVGAVLLFGCSRGYVETRDLERTDRGPTACAARCGELGMRMGALVLVSDQTPACVCEPLPTSGSEPTVDGAAGAASAHAVIAAAAAQEAQRQQQQRQHSLAASSTR